MRRAVGASSGPSTAFVPHFARDDGGTHVIDHKFRAPSIAARDTRAGAVAVLRIRGQQVGTASGRAIAYLGVERLGELVDGANLLQIRRGGTLPGARIPLRIRTGDEGTWFAVERAELLAKRGGRTWRIGEWRCDAGAAAGKPFEQSLTITPTPPEEIVRSSAVFLGADTSRGGDWEGRIGASSVMLPGVSDRTSRAFQVSVKQGIPFVWAESTDDARALTLPESHARRSSCWFGDSEVALMVGPPDRKPYRLTLYILDSDRNGRAESVSIGDEEGELDRQAVSSEACVRGAYLTWRVAGPAVVRIRKTAGYNAVVSGVFVDRE